MQANGISSSRHLGQHGLFPCCKTLYKCSPFQLHTALLFLPMFSHYSLPWSWMTPSQHNLPPFPHSNYLWLHTVPIYRAAVEIVGSFRFPGIDTTSYIICSLYTDAVNQLQESSSVYLLAEKILHVHKDALKLLQMHNIKYSDRMPELAEWWTQPSPSQGYHFLPSNPSLW